MVAKYQKFYLNFYLLSVIKSLKFKFNNFKFLIKKQVWMRGKQPVKGGLKKKIERPGLTED